MRPDEKHKKLSFLVGIRLTSSDPLIIQPPSHRHATLCIAFSLSGNHTLNPCDNCSGQKSDF